MIATYSARRAVPALLGFAVALGVAFAASFLVGRSVGPVAPDLRPGPQQSSGDGGMPGMPGMTMEGTHR
ncbi:hypothetical protein [Streptomyces sp. RPT161]|uniref:hypothetical protein n=1 Tax=Streptomyces sp. RPT161 TaxID=3015993 RepID=UPI0022B85B17|nr:hypothetical protein [Streptomyces sp. RPT161]